MTTWVTGWDLPASPAVKGDHLDVAELWFPVPPLAGDVVLLRPWREADVPGLVAAFSDPVMQRFSWRTTAYTETDARDYVAEQEQARVPTCLSREPAATA